MLTEGFVVHVRERLHVADVLGAAEPLLRAGHGSCEYPVPSTQYRVPSTQYGVQSTPMQSAECRHPAYSVLGTGYSVLGTRYSVLRTPLSPPTQLALNSGGNFRFVAGSGLG